MRRKHDHVKVGGVAVVHWNPPRNPLMRKLRLPVPASFRVGNFGDLLGPIIVNRMLSLSGLSGVPFESKGRVLAVGSILHLAQSGDVVWGSGLNGKSKDSNHDFVDLDVRAVRGPLTEKYLETRGIAVPGIYGDPALLLPQLFPEYRKMRADKIPVLLAPNLHDYHSWAASSTHPAMNPTGDLFGCITAILQARFVIASSLHALIIAEAFGVPARAVISGREPRLKYDDYFLSTGREEVQMAQTPAEAEVMGPQSAGRFDPNPLLASFPLELWTG